MAKQYIFEFDGTREQFLELLKQFPCYSEKLYRLDDYLVEHSSDELRFGVRRGGHSGGDWFIPTVSEVDGKTIFCGEIRYKDAYGGGKGMRKIEEILLWILLLPIIVIVYVYRFFAWIVRKIINKPKPKEETSEDNLFDLMENYLHCTRK